MNFSPCHLSSILVFCFVFFFFQAEDGIRDRTVTGVQTCALPIFANAIEPRTSIGCYDPFERRYTLYSGVQAPFRQRKEISGTVLHFPETNLRVVARSEERRVGKECRSRLSPDH